MLKPMDDQAQRLLERIERKVNEIASVVFAMAGSLAGYLAYLLIENSMGIFHGIVDGIAIAFACLFCFSESFTLGDEGRSSAPTRCRIRASP
jgi:hypothetical protein